MKMLGDVRWTVLGLLFLGGMINYLDRSAIGVAAPFLAKQLSLSPSELGWVFSVFFFGYAAFCFVGGYASDRIGAAQRVRHRGGRLVGVLRPDRLRV